MANKTNVQNHDKVQLMAIESLCFYVFFRISSEAIRISGNEIKVDNEERLYLHIPFSKTNRTGRKMTVYIYNNDTVYSPSKWVFLGKTLDRLQTIRGYSLSMEELCEVFKTFKEAD